MAVMSLFLGLSPHAARAAEKPLGATVEGRSTTFRLYAPKATSVRLVLFARFDADTGREVAMTRDGDGVWELTVDGAGYGGIYGYRIDGPRDDTRERFDPSVVVGDPYARAVVTHNVYRQPTKTIVVDTSYDWRGDTYVAPADHNRLVIYEAHVRDLTAHRSAGSSKPGTYAALAELGRPGGLSYLKSLGVNAVELLPVQEFNNIEPYGPKAKLDDGLPVTTNLTERNHWGYMTSYFFAPESAYASDGTTAWGAYSGTRASGVRELKDTIRALHREGIAVILDVVYNHTSEFDRNPLKYAAASEYYRIDASGTFESRSGCGNDMKTESPAARRLILDSVRYWMREYHVDGFRFDLATLIDPETQSAILAAAREINPNAIVIAEPWGGPYDPSGLSDRGWASWNDQIRNGVKGRNPREPLPKDAPGFIFGRFEDGKTNASLRSFVTGTLRADGGLFLRPEDSVNYLESHDDNTMGDYVRMVTGAVGFRQKVANPIANATLTPRQLAIERLGALYLLTSHGPVMIAEGQEFGRSKLIVQSGVADPLVGTLDDNSYNKDDATNYLDYNHARRNAGLVTYYRGLLDIRRSFPAISSAPASAVRFVETGDDLVVAYTVPVSESRRVAVLMNGNPDRDASVELPPGRWRVLANATSASARRTLGVVSDTVRVPRTSGLILLAGE